MRLGGNDDPKEAESRATSLVKVVSLKMTVLKSINLKAS